MRWSSPVPRAHGTRTASPPGGGRPAGRPSSRDRARDGLAALLPETARSMDSATPQLLIRARCSQSYPDLAVSSRPRACVRASPASATCRTQQLTQPAAGGCLYCSGDRGLPASASRSIASRRSPLEGSRRGRVRACGRARNRPIGSTSLLRP